MYKELWGVFQDTVSSCFNPEARQTFGQKLKVGFRITPAHGLAPWIQEASSEVG